MTQQTQINFTYPDTGVLRNYMQAIRSLSVSDPSILDTNNYPASTPAADITGSIQFPSWIGGQVSGTWVLKGHGKANIRLDRGSPGFTSATVTAGGASCSIVGSTANNMQVQCTANVDWRVTFQFGTIVPAGGVTFRFLSGGTTFDGTLSGLVLCRVEDEAAIDGAADAGDLFASEFIAKYTALKPNVIRTMGLVNPNGGNISQSRYLPSWRYGFWSADRWEPSAMAADIGGGKMATTGTNTYACGLEPGAQSASVYTDGEMIHLKFINAGSGTLTINSGGRGDVALLIGTGSNIGNALTTIPANTLATLVYDAVLQGFLYTTGGQVFAAPYEAQIGLAKKLNADLWFVLPSYVDDASVTFVTTLIRDNLPASLNAYIEYSNEIWNASFSQTPWAVKKGAALGFPSDNNRQFNGWYALRFRKIMELATAAWSPRSSSQLRRILVWQGALLTTAIETYRVLGADLASVAKGGQGNALFVSYTGDADYTKTVGTGGSGRPLDYTDWFSYGFYYSGAQLNSFDAKYVITQGAFDKLVTGGASTNPVQLTITSHGYNSGQRAFFKSSSGNAFTGTGWSTLNGQSLTITKIDANTISVPVDGSAFPAYSSSGGRICRYGNEITGLTAAADNYATGTPSLMQSALDWVDADLRNGTNYGATATAPGDETTTQANTNIYPYWNTLAAKYSKSVANYESSCESWYPSTASCTALGISTAYGGAGGKVDLLLQAYKLDWRFYKLVKDQRTQFLAKSMSQIWSWFVFSGPNQWALTNGDAFAALFQSATAFIDFNAGTRHMKW